jgi:ATP-binding cassette subfamily B protein
VRAAGRAILEEIDLSIAAGEHVAIVGPSGAGKSSLLGVLLGWHRCAQGEVRVDGEALALGRLERLRRETAWVDPAVQLWNRSVLENLLYGSDDAETRSLTPVIADAELERVLESLPRGLQSPVGEGGALVSGGEGQRLRFGRACIRAGARLVLLDEPFRGLDRERRRVLLARARARWREATLLCVTHDVGDTVGFPRVLVLDGGRVVEDGTPAELRRAGSLYRSLLDSERAVTRALGAGWRRVRLEAGALAERDAGPAR